eukprot:COSAG06_NODE_1978_length_7929_cov_17.252298_3_plen_131_part_00
MMQDFENVGGDVWAAVLPLLNKNARVTRCGLMSQQVSEGGGGAKEWEAQGAAVIAAQNVRAQSLFVGTVCRPFSPLCITASISFAHTPRCLANAFDKLATPAGHVRSCRRPGAQRRSPVTQCFKHTRPSS